MPQYSGMASQLTHYMHFGSEMLFFILLLFFIIHGTFLSYHWFTYGTSKNISLAALATYLAGGAVLFLTFSLGLNTI
jgi:hypothetical protein